MAIEMEIQEIKLSDVNPETVTLSEMVEFMRNLSPSVKNALIKEAMHGVQNR